MSGSPLATARLVYRFRDALGRGRRQHFWRRLQRRRPCLVSLDDALAGRLVTRLASRLEQVPLLEIRGSASRAEDYSAGFLPLRASDEDRWVRVALALEGAGLPPVSLLSDHDTYFVEDGHHRVSVLRYFRVRTVSASVVELADISGSAVRNPAHRPGRARLPAIPGSAQRRAGLERLGPRLERFCPAWRVSARRGLRRTGQPCLQPLG